jgi:hypothetical protein
LTEPDLAELARPRDLNQLLSDSFGLYRKHFGTFLAIAFVVVVPVHAIVLGVGLGQFTGGYDATPPPEITIGPAVVQVLVVGPLVSVMVLYVLLQIAAGAKPSAGRAIQEGLDAFAPVFLPVLIAVACEAAAIITIVGFFILFVRWYLVPQLVVVEKKRGTDALRESWELTRGFAWRTAGLILVVQLLFGLAEALVATPIAAIAEEADSEAVGLAATTLARTLVVAPIGIFAALLYFDLRSRQTALRR